MDLFQIIPGLYHEYNWGDERMVYLGELSHLQLGDAYSWSSFQWDPFWGDQVLDVKISMVHLMDFCGKMVHYLGWLGNILMICCRRFLKDFLVVFHPETWGTLIQFDEHIFFQMGGAKNHQLLGGIPDTK